MTTRSFILAVGFVVAALVCFVPPNKKVVNEGYKTTAHNLEYYSYEVTDYPALFLRLGGVLFLTGAAWAVAGGRRRLVVDADRVERSVQ